MGRANFKPLGLIFFVSAVVLLLGGCLDLGSSSTSQVGVLDLDRLAQDAGLKTQLQAELEKTPVVLNGRFEAATELNARRKQADQQKNTRDK